jgi:hypothetical protein
MIDSIERNIKSNISEITNFNSEVIDVDNIQDDKTVVTYI